jgi:glycine cleavage system H protein
MEDGRAWVGITDFAQEALGDVVYVSLPELGAELAQGDVLGEVESTKAVSELYAPVSGRVVERNESLVDTPGTLNEDPYGSGWVCVLQVETDAPVEGLLSAEEYRALTAS